MKEFRATDHRVKAYRATEAQLLKHHDGERVVQPGEWVIDYGAGIESESMSDGLFRQLYTKVEAEQSDGTSTEATGPVEAVAAAVLDAGRAGKGQTRRRAGR